MAILFFAAYVVSLGAFVWGTTRVKRITAQIRLAQPRGRVNLVRAFWAMAGGLVGSSLSLLLVLASTADSKMFPLLAFCLLTTETVVVLFCAFAFSKRKNKS